MWTAYVPVTGTSTSQLTHSVGSVQYPIVFLCGSGSYRTVLPWIVASRAWSTMSAGTAAGAPEGAVAVADDAPEEVPAGSVPGLHAPSRRRAMTIDRFMRSPLVRADSHACRNMGG